MKKFTIKNLPQILRGDSRLTTNMQFDALKEYISQIVPDPSELHGLWECAVELAQAHEFRGLAQELQIHQATSMRWLAAALYDAAGDFQSASATLNSICWPSRPAEAFRLQVLARTLAKSGMAADAVPVLRRSVRLSESYKALSACGKILRSLEQVGVVHNPRTCRLALLGNATFDLWLPILRTVAFANGIDMTVHSGAYNQHVQEILDGDSKLHKFSPQIIVLATDWRMLGLPEEVENPKATVDEKVSDVARTWKAISDRFACHVIQHNFVIPEISAYGGLSSSLRGGRASILREINLRLSECAAGVSQVSVLDVDQIASLVGKRLWHDARMWIVAKQYPAAEAIGSLAKHQVARVRALLGMSSKCLVLDLDNTLWGGVVGEDGLEGIRLGGSAEGEAFVEFQHYVKGLRERGVILAVCSKNNEPDAMDVFRHHPETVLKLDDFAVFLANWQSKIENLRGIADRLNIGTDSLVFVDDNPAEREHVRREMPEVEVLELPLDPALYAETLDRELFFETISLTSEDKQRGESYRANQHREILRESSGSIEEFLSALQMRVELRSFDQLSLPRIVQLINKTNQFNLTTLRMSSEQVQAFTMIPGNYTQSMNLRDRYGDNGLTGVLMASAQGEALNIDVWLLSCRVLGRRIEDAMLAGIWNFARSSGFRTLHGTFFPTAKNRQVANLYDRLGFALIRVSDEGQRFYSAELAADRPFPLFMDVSNLTLQSTGTVR